MRWLRTLFSRPPSAPAPAEAPAPAAAPPSPADASSWVSHQRPAEAGPAVIAVDLALAPRAPVADRPRLVRVRCALRSPREDGQPQGPELEALAEVEDVLGACLAPLGAVYAGRVTLAGVREHLLYLPDAAPVQEALAHAQTRLAGYLLELHGDDDPTWHAYREELYPSPRTLRLLLDRGALEALRRQGGASGTRSIDHQASFPDAGAREAFAAEAASQGFEVVARRDDAPAPNPYAVDLRRTDPLALPELHRVTWGLTELAGRHGGGYDGWALDEAGQAA